jgi:antitoxin (DNA-binding transcriptional repressor) of toxin-antitoxin stability system
MKEMTVGEFKTKFSQALDEVQGGSSVNILYGRARKPVAMLVPYIEKKRGKRKIGILDGIATFSEEGDGKITIEEFLGEV